MNIEILLSRIQLLCQEKNISMTTAFTDSGVGKNFKCNLKFANPSEGKITMLANYFDVSVAYLKGETEQRNTTALSPQKQAIHNELDEMTPEQLEQIHSYIKFIKSQK